MSAIKSFDQDELVRKRRVLARPERRVVRYDPTYDSYRRYLTDAPTPARLAGYIQDIDQGDVAAMIELNEEMEGKDAHLQGVANTRREAVTALEYDIMPDPMAIDEKAAVASAEWMAEKLRKVKGFEDTLQHMSTAIGPGVSVSEMIWRRGALVELCDIPGHRLVSNPDVSTDINVITNEEPVRGVPTPRMKFIVYTPKLRAGYPLRVTITRAQAYLWIIKHYAIADWSQYQEIFGMPFRAATLKPGASPKEAETVATLLETMSADTWALFTDAVDIQMVRADSGTPPYPVMLEWIERKQSILYLGQTLTTELGSTGSFAAARVHDNVKASILLSDLRSEATAIQDQIFKPCLMVAFPGKDVPVPLFKRRVIEEKNIAEDQLVIEKIRLMVELKLPVAPEWVYENLGIPEPIQEDDEGDPTP